MTRRQGLGAARTPRGSAAVEFAVMVPFILALVAMVWDIRELLGSRTDIARQIHVAVAAAADDAEGAGTPADPRPMVQAMVQLRALLEDRSASGSIAAAVVTRGTAQRDGTPCSADAWCPPRVTAAWPATPELGRWADGGDACTTAGPNPLPSAGEHVPADVMVLPREGRAGSESAWISRNLGETEWWVVADVCFEPRPGTFSGRLANLPVRLFEGSSVLRRRVAWRSIHEFPQCSWCN